MIYCRGKTKKMLYFCALNQQLPYIIKQSSGASCLDKACYTAIDEVMQPIGGSPHAETKQLFAANLAMWYTCHRFIVRNKIWVLTADDMHWFNRKHSLPFQCTR